MTNLSKNFGAMSGIVSTALQAQQASSCMDDNLVLIDIDDYNQLISANRELQNHNQHLVQQIENQNFMFRELTQNYNKLQKKYNALGDVGRNIYLEKQDLKKVIAKYESEIAIYESEIARYEKTIEIIKARVAKAIGKQEQKINELRLMNHKLKKQIESYFM